MVELPDLEFVIPGCTLKLPEIGKCRGLPMMVTHAITLDGYWASMIEREPLIEKLR